MSRAFTRACLGVIALALFPSSVARAQSEDRLYVSDELQITMRSGPGEGYRVLRTLTTGTAAVPSQRQEEWVRIELEDGQRGWVLSRYLDPEKPARMELAAARAALSKAEQRAAALENELAALRAERADAETLRAQVLELEAENARLARAAAARQLIVGAGIVLVGVLIGAIWSRSRSRSLSMPSRKLKL